MANILCIDDSAEFGIYLTSILGDHDLTVCETLNEAYKLFQTGRKSFDLILLDVNLPDGNGIKSIGQLRGHLADPTVPILMLTNDDDILSKVSALGLGADDYIIKPIVADELKARIGARLRTRNLLQKKINSISFGNLVIDIDKMNVEQKCENGKTKTLELTPLEFKILKLLTTRPGQIFSRDQVIDFVWGVGKFISERTVDAHISHLRKKLAESNVEITTVINVGYKATLRQIDTSLETKDTF